MITEVLEEDVNAALEIFSDLTGRCGIGNAIEECDDGIQQEIKATMAQIIAKHRPLPDELSLDE